MSTKKPPSLTVPALVTEVNAALDSLESLRQHREKLGEDIVRTVLDVVQDSRRRLTRSELYVCIVGEKKVGKSTFLNALLGQRVLGVAVRECTGTVTLLRNGPKVQYRAQYSSGISIEFDDNFPDRDQEFVQAIKQANRKSADQQEHIAHARKEHARQRLIQFHNDIRRLTDMQQGGSDVTQLDLTYPAAFLPAGLVVIDTPGVNTDNVQNRSRAWDIIRREADGCIVLSDIQQAISASTREFIGEVRKVVPHLILILTKVDRALAAADVGDGSAEEQLEEARQTGEKRFAKAVGRDPREIHTLAVAAERALAKDDPATLTRFTADVDRLLAVLKHERALIVASRCATAIQDCSAGITEAQNRAENKYRQRIATLESHQISQPEQFCAEQLARFEAGIHQAVRSAIERGRQKLFKRIKVVTDDAIAAVMACSSADALKKVGGTIESMLSQLRKKVDRAVMREASDRARELDDLALEALKERYRIVEGLTSRAGRKVGDRQMMEYSDGGNHLESSLSKSVADYQFSKGVGVLGGAATGAIVGSFVPVIGTAIGALVGGVIGAFFGPSFDTVKRDCAQSVVKALQEQQDAIEAQLNQSEEGLAHAIRKALTASLKSEVKRYRSWIADVIEEEREKLQHERDQLSHLVALRKALNDHDARLQDLMHQAAEESKGICRDAKVTRQSR